MVAEILRSTDGVKFQSPSIPCTSYDAWFKEISISQKARDTVIIKTRARRISNTWMKGSQICTWVGCQGH